MLLQEGEASSSYWLTEAVPHLSVNVDWRNAGPNVSVGNNWLCDSDDDADMEAEEAGPPTAATAWRDINTAMALSLDGHMGTAQQVCPEVPVIADALGSMPAVFGNTIFYPNHICLVQ